MSTTLDRGTAQAWQYCPRDKNHGTKVEYYTQMQVVRCVVCGSYHQIPLTRTKRGPFEAES